MRLITGLCLLVVCTVCVRSEECTVNGDCHATSCAANFHVICEHKNEDGVTPNGGLCSCAADQTTCKTKADCDSMSFTCAPNRNKHCYDSKCICTRW